MKVVTSLEMSELEKLAYDEGASAEAFMNQAGEKIAEIVQRFIAKKHIKPLVCLLAGKGNNAGDGYVAARLLLEGGFQVESYSLFPLEEMSPLCQLQAQRFLQAGGRVHFIKQPQEIDFSKSTLLLDGLLGTGFKGPLQGILKETIERANASKVPIISIDVPSGINGTSGEFDVAIHATATVFLGLAKRGCFVADAWEHVGKVFVQDFGLKEKFIEKAHQEFELLEEHTIRQMLPALLRRRHKYQAGYVVGLGGTPGMPGAAILTSFAALKTGCGIVRLLHPASMGAELSGAPYEVIREGYENSSQVVDAMQRATALFIGPGIGVEAKTAELLNRIFSQVIKPCVVDAEALTLMAQHGINPPKHAVLTPHVGECHRLLHLLKQVSFEELFKHCQSYVDKWECTLVLKGSPTFIFHPQKPPCVSPRGDPGMATAGSGDVLTGMIAAFLAAQKTPLEAAQLGVYLHGMAGEYAAEKLTSYCMMATDIIDALPEVFKHLLT